MEAKFSSILEKGIYVDKEYYEQRGIVVFDDNQLEIKFVDYEKLLSHLIDSITKALNISSTNKVSGTFVLLFTLIQIENIISINVLFLILLLY